MRLDVTYCDLAASFTEVSNTLTKKNINESVCSQTVFVFFVN